MAANRYEKITTLLSNTMPRLSASTQFQQLVETLRSEDWLDWHILVGVYNIAANYRLDEANLNTYEAISTAAGQRAARELTETSAIDEGAPIPLDCFDEAAVCIGRRQGIDPLVMHWGLQSRQRTPDYQRSNGSWQHATATGRSTPTTQTCSRSPVRRPSQGSIRTCQRCAEDRRVNDPGRSATGAGRDQRERVDV